MLTNVRLDMSKFSTSMQKQINCINNVVSMVDLIFENCYIIDRSNDWSLLSFKEAYHIRRCDPSIESLRCDNALARRGRPEVNIQFLAFCACVCKK